MRKLELVGTALAAVLATGCGGDAGWTYTEGGVDVAREPLSPPASQGQQTAKEHRRAQVEAYLEGRSRHWNIVASEELPSGEIVDYVAADTLVRGAANAPFLQPPPMPNAGPSGDEDGKAEMMMATSGRPAGTIPMVRPKFKRFVDGHTGTDSLEELLGRGKPAPNHQGNRLYARHRDNLTHTATAGRINLWNYIDVGGTNEFSLMQGGTFCGTGSSLEGIEFGFQEFPDKYDDSVPHFFTFYRTAGGATGDLTGGYNMDFDGFIPGSGATITPGAAMSTSTFSALGGTQYGCDVEAQLFQGNWWVYACNAWQGYYPGPDSSVSASKRIPFNLIDDAACWAQWYGEVWDSSPSTWTDANMGSGQWPSGGYRMAAYMSKLRHQTSSGVVW